MKRLLFLFLLPLHLSSFSQSLKIVEFDTLVIGDALNSNALFAHAKIQNITNQTINVHVKRGIIDLNELTDSNAICWGVCYPPDVSVSNNALSIEAGAIDSLYFTGHVYPDGDGQINEGVISYTFFNEENENDKVTIEVKYKIDIMTSINEKSNKIIVFPNPATDQLFIQADESKIKSIQIFALTGQRIFDTHIINRNHFSINTSLLHRGYYIYQIVLNDENIKGKLLLN